MKYEKPKFDVLTLEVKNIIKTSGMTEWDDADLPITPKSAYNWTR